MVRWQTHKVLVDMEEMISDGFIVWIKEGPILG